MYRWLIVSLLCAATQVHAITCSELNGAYIAGLDPSRKFLGFFGSSVPLQSIYNRQINGYGNGVGFDGVNGDGIYANQSSEYSHRNPAASRPPVIVRNGRFVGFLSTNPALSPRAELTQIDASCSFSAMAAAVTLGEVPPDPFQGNAPVINSGYSGLWWHPSRNGEGVALDFALGGGKALLLFTFYAHDSERYPMFLVGSAEVPASERTVAFTVYYTFGSPLQQAFDPNAVEAIAVGEVNLHFFGCERITMSFLSAHSAFGSIQTELERFLPRLSSQTCL